MCVLCDKLGISSPDNAAGSGSASSAAVTTSYTDAIDWGTQVNSGQTNADGDMIIEYYFQPGTGSFSIFPRLEWTAYKKQQV